MNNVDQNRKNRQISIVAKIIFFVSFVLINEFVFNYKMENRIREYLNQPDYVILEENYELILKYDSLNKSDFSDHWRFSHIIIGENEFEPDSDNNYAFESVIKDFDGSYDGHEIRVFYFVDLYQPDVNLEEEFQIQMLDITSDDNERPLNNYSYLKSGDIQYISRCSDGRHPTSCQIIFHSGAKFGRVTVYSGEWIIPDDTLNEMINELITIIL